MRRLYYSRLQEDREDAARARDDELRLRMAQDERDALARLLATDGRREREVVRHIRAMQAARGPQGGTDQ